MTDDQIRLQFQYLGADKAEELVRVHAALDAEMKRVATTAGTVEKATDGMTRSTANFGYTALQTGRIVQDFAQGGIGGILNNIEGLTVALGLGTGLAGILTIVGVAAAVAGPKLIDFAKGLVDGTNAIPEAADQTKRFDDELKNVNKELDGLKEKQSLTNTELERFNLLTAEAIKLENDLAQARDAAKMMQAPGADQRARADEVQAIFKQMGGPDAIRSVQEAYRKQFGDRGPGGDREATILLQNAMKGQADAFNALQELMLSGAGRGTKFGQIMGKTEPAFDIPGMGFVDDPQHIAAGEKNRLAMEKGWADAEKKAKDYWLDVEIAAEKASMHLIELQNKDAMAREKVETKEKEKLEEDERKAREQQIAASGAGAEAGNIYAAARGRGRSPDQAFEEATQRALAFLNRQIGVDDRGRAIRANRGMSDEQKNLLATQIASQGRERVNQGVAGLAGQNLTTTGKLLMVSQGLDAEVTALAQRLNNIEMRAQGLQIKGNARRRGAQKVKIN